MPRMRRLAFALVVMLGLMTAACGSAPMVMPTQPVQPGPTVAVIPYVPGVTPIPTPSPTLTVELTNIPTQQPTTACTPAAAAPELRRAGFRYADVPSGWSRSAVDNASLLVASDVVGDGKRLQDPTCYDSSAGVQFSQSDTGPFLLQYPWQSGTVADAQKEMAFSRQTLACSTWEVTASSGADVVERIRPVAMAPVGDESVAAHMTLEVSGKAILEMQSVDPRVGSVPAEVTLAGGSQSSPALHASPAQAAVQRIHDAGF
jgi:hypothetical protein